MTAHEVDYHIYGEEMQYVEIELDPQEAVVAEAGNFMMMDSGIRMETIFGDGSGQDQGIMGKLFSAGKRLLTGESLFMTVFLNEFQGKRKVSIIYHKSELKLHLIEALREVIMGVVRGAIAFHNVKIISPVSKK